MNERRISGLPALKPVPLRSHATQTNKRLVNGWVGECMLGGGYLWRADRPMPAQALVDRRCLRTQVAVSYTQQHATNPEQIWPRPPTPTRVLQRKRRPRRDITL
jgi:hypothetical protein